MLTWHRHFEIAGGTESRLFPVGGRSLPGAMSRSLARAATLRRQIKNGRSFPGDDRRFFCRSAIDVPTTAIICQPVVARARSGGVELRRQARFSEERGWCADETPELSHTAVGLANAARTNEELTCWVDYNWNPRKRPAVFVRELRRCRGRGMRDQRTVFGISVPHATPGLVWSGRCKRRKHLPTFLADPNGKWEWTHSSLLWRTVSRWEDDVNVINTTNWRCTHAGSYAAAAQLHESRDWDVRTAGETTTKDWQ